MTVKSERVEVGDEPTLISSVAAFVDRVPGQHLMVENLGEVELDLGGEDVTSGAGHPLPPGRIVTHESVTASDLFYVVAPAGQVGLVAVTRAGL